MSTLRITSATPEHTELLLILIRELAEAEQFPFPVTVTSDDLVSSLFGPNPAAEAVLAFSENNPVGFAVFYSTFATTTGRPGMHLDDLYVRPQYRGKGFGRKLLGHVARVAQSRGCARLEWWSLRTNASAMQFYKAQGARPMEELLVFRTQGPSLEELAQ